jgi:hypothetical protein
MRKSETKEKHTPGPWEIVVRPKKHSSGVYHIRQKKLRYPHIKTMDSHLMIAELYAHRFGSADNVPGHGMNDLAGSNKEGCQHANARLIEAAPRLLKALESTLNSLENWVEIQDAEDARDYDAKAIAEARAVIKQVKGER